MSKLIVEGRGCELFAGGEKNVGLDEKLLGAGWLQGAGGRAGNGATLAEEP